MKSLLILDVTCPKPYDAFTLRQEPMGGTEATVVRVAEGLAETGQLEVFVAQHNRRAIQEEGKAHYISFDELPDSPHAVVVLRVPDLLPDVHACYPKSQIYLWLHDYNQEAVNRWIEPLREFKT